MNEIVNRSLLVGDKVMPEMHLNNLVLLIVLADHLPEIKKELEILCRLEIQTLFTEMSLIKLAFIKIWLMVNQKI